MHSPFHFVSCMNNLAFWICALILPVLPIPVTRSPSLETSNSVPLLPGQEDNFLPRHYPQEEDQENMHRTWSGEEATHDNPLFMAGEITAMDTPRFHPDYADHISLHPRVSEELGSINSALHETHPHHLPAQLWFVDERNRIKDDWPDESPTTRHPSSFINPYFNRERGSNSSSEVDDKIDGNEVGWKAMTLHSQSDQTPSHPPLHLNQESMSHVIEGSSESSKPASFSSGTSAPSTSSGKYTSSEDHRNGLSPWIRISPPLANAAFYYNQIEGDGDQLSFSSASSPASDLPSSSSDPDDENWIRSLHELEQLPTSDLAEAIPWLDPKQEEFKDETHKSRISDSLHLEQAVNVNEELPPVSFESGTKISRSSSINWQTSTWKDSKLIELASQSEYSWFDIASVVEFPNPQAALLRYILLTWEGLVHQVRPGLRWNMSSVYHLEQTIRSVISDDELYSGGLISPTALREPYISQIAAATHRESVEIEVQLLNMLLCQEWPEIFNPELLNVVRLKKICMADDTLPLSSTANSLSHAHDLLWGENPDNQDSNFGIAEQHGFEYYLLEYGCTFLKDAHLISS